ncbi:putative ABC transporter ATPase and permease protein [Actinoplanes missouriensis 431]|uniref:Putative ABC transporter ATPase and permease protein n=1 Tax=Actinoplanes missouriensis (strain ATCC 14538 / DSM 43046 / CBS 188.64 / JCM 3121 / NBRC 102363 / NCIMB 12654 / NRRL B-3342 / UNCC 431) TaxID=512565 RepID=I0H1H7_ACTM4|nr:ABC transporter ATP-binding protein [Actinoplanes missouriensis]BAL86864.1 putative ABC transporter ATPase and permease protein [Actinoplanes missouriensis 431]
MSMPSWTMLRSIQNSDQVKRHQVKPGTARRITQFARPYRRDITVFLLTVVVAAGIGVATPLLAGHVINAITGGGPQAAGTVVRLALLIAGLAVADALLSLAQRWYSARIGEGIILTLRTRVFDHVQRMPLQFFTRTQTGALVSRLNNDVVGAQRAFTSTLSGVLSNVIQLVLTAAVMFTLSWQITVLSLVLLPVFIIPARRVGSRLAEITRESYNLDAKMNATMTERFNVSGALLVKLFGRPDVEATRFGERAERVRDIGVQQAMYSRTFFVAMLLVASLAQALTYGLGGWLAVRGQVSAGTVVTLALLLTRLYGPLTALSNVRVDVMSALVSFDRVFEVLDLAPGIAEKPGATPIPAGAGRIEFRDVRFRYPSADEVSLATLEDVVALDRRENELVLDGVDFTVEPGRMVALVGPSGAGKSTTSMLLSRVYDVSDGAVLIDGVDVRDATLGSLRDTIGVVTQDSHLFHETIAENLRYASPGATEEQMWAALEGAQVADLVRALPDGLDTVVGERGYRFSGGEKQRIAIARILLKQPSIVVLDEATAHLDSESEAAVQRALAAALRGRTAVVIAHRLSTIRDADEILVLDHGRIVERGRHTELMTAGGLYSELYRTQFAATSPAYPEEDVEVLTVPARVPEL